MDLQIEAKNVLEQLALSLQTLNKDEYIAPVPLLRNSSIGEHTRHIVELFMQLLQGYETGIVNYDDRKRDIQLQENIDFAIETIAGIIAEINVQNKTLQLKSVYNNEEAFIDTNYYRELMYNIEHCIHHQAILKIGFECLNIQHVDENYGVAKSTTTYRKQCAQ